MRPMTHLSKLLGSSALALIIVLGGFSVAPARAHAQFSIPILETKEYILDPLAWVAKEVVKQSITKSIVNWINSGFDGSPAFATDLKRNLGRLSDAVANSFFDELEDRTGVDINSPFQEQITDYLRAGYYRNTGDSGFFNQEGYTLHRIANRDKAFLDGDFAEGGWDAWFSVVTNSNNNPIGALFRTQDELGRRIEEFRVTRLNELSWGRGFLAWKGECVQEAGETAEEQALADDEGCLEHETVTPGAVIEGRLAQALDMSTASLDIADEMNEIIAALVSQLTKQVLGGTGLTGVSRPQQGGGGSYLDQASNPGIYTGSGTGASLVAEFARTVDNQATQLERYRSRWEQIRDAAQEAVTACPATGAAEAREALERANTQIARADRGLEELAEIRRGITEVQTQAGIDVAATIAALNSRYSQLVGSGVFPSQTEFQEAIAETGTNSDTLLSRLKALAQSCREG